MARRVLIVGSMFFVLVLLPGCPPGGFYGRYIVVNSTGEAIHEVLLSDGDHSHPVPALVPNQAWLAAKALAHRKKFMVSWKDEFGESKVSIDISSKSGYRCLDDILIELQKNGAVKWRLVPRAD